MDNYKNKYLKYKKKYLNLQRGGIKTCQNCTFDNPDNKLKCEICDSKLESSPIVLKKTPIVKSIERGGIKTCQNCTFDNSDDKLKCELCDSKLESSPIVKSIETCGITKRIPVNQYRRLEYPFASGNTLAVLLKIEKIFNERPWLIHSSHGDGKCLLYTIFQSIDIDLSSLDIIDFVADRFLEYAKLNEEMCEKSLDFVTSKYEIITIYNNDDKETIKIKLRILFNDNNLSDLFIQVLSKTMNINILLLNRDEKEKESMIYNMKYYDSEIEDSKYLILLNTQGHYMSVIPIGHPEMTRLKIQEIMKGRLW